MPAYCSLLCDGDGARRRGDGRRGGSLSEIEILQDHRRKRDVRYTCDVAGMLLVFVNLLLSCARRRDSDLLF